MKMKIWKDKKDFVGLAMPEHCCKAGGVSYGTVFRNEYIPKEIKMPVSVGALAGLIKIKMKGKLCFYL